MKHTADEVLKLLGEHGGRLFTLLVRLTLRSDVAEDLMQDLFCKLTQSPGFRRAGDPYAYAFRAATNLAFSYRRSRAKTRHANVSPSVLAGPDHPPLADLVRREELDRVLDAIGQLSSASRNLIVLRFLDRESYETIGQRLGKTPHHARAACHKALVRLRRTLGSASLDEL